MAFSLSLWGVHRIFILFTKLNCFLLYLNLYFTLLINLMIYFVHVAYFLNTFSAPVVTVITAPDGLDSGASIYEGISNLPAFGEGCS
jgi:hypothetical protein